MAFVEASDAPVNQSHHHGDETMKATLSDLVRRATAFRDFADMAQAMDDGYKPSLYGSAAASELADELERLGYQVFRGN